MDIERAKKICQMIYELFKYIDSTDDEIDKKVSMHAAVMTMIDIIASSNKEDCINTTKRILEDFETRRDLIN